MNRARGTLLISDAYGRVEERHTFTCAHCSGIRTQTQATQNWCMNCDAMVCNDRICSSECAPFKRKLDQMENRQHFLECVGV